MQTVELHPDQVLPLAATADGVNLIIRDIPMSRHTYVLQLSAGNVMLVYERIHPRIGVMGAIPHLQDLLCAPIAPVNAALIAPITLHVRIIGGDPEMVRKSTAMKVRHCLQCGAALSLGNRAGKCRDCYLREKYGGDGQAALKQARSSITYVRRMLLHLRAHIDGILAELPEDPHMRTAGDPAKGGNDAE